MQYTQTKRKAAVLYCRLDYRTLLWIVLVRNTNLYHYLLKPAVLRSPDFHAFSWNSRHPPLTFSPNGTVHLKTFLSSFNALCPFNSQLRGAHFTGAVLALWHTYTRKRTRCYGALRNAHMQACFHTDTHTHHLCWNVYSLPQTHISPEPDASL